MAMVDWLIGLNSSVCHCSIIQRWDVFPRPLTLGLAMRIALSNGILAGGMWTQTCLLGGACNPLPVPSPWEEDARWPLLSHFLIPQNSWVTIWPTALWLTNKLFLLGMAVHTYNPSYLGGGDWEDHGLRSVWAKRYQEQDSISTKELGMVVYTCHLSYTGSI
jgi:hypothetical protein